MEREVLDHAELLHLAVSASVNQHHGDAIEYLKRAIAAVEKNFEAIYLLAAEYAEIGMIDRAIAKFNEALNLKPDFQPARFQLGLILTVAERPEEALEIWKRLEHSDGPYRHFKRGLEALIRNELSLCIQELQLGMELNNGNPALNRDMGNLLARTKAQIDACNAGGAPSGTGDMGSAVLAAYRAGDRAR